jgi:RNA polymerase-binding transcription factor DksA
MSGLDQASLQQLAKRLDSRDAQLREEIRQVNAEQAAAASANPNNQVEDLGEQGEERIRDAVRHAEKERDLAELREIEAARERLMQGRYGECTECGIDIPLARLEARPSAARCVPCQQKLEQMRHAGGRMLSGL